MFVFTSFLLSIFSLTFAEKAKFKLKLINSNPDFSNSLDTKEEIWFRSIAKAIRFLGTDYKTIMTYMNPINKKRYKHNDRLCVVRLKK